MVAAYNRADVIGHAVRSVVSQDMRDWELLVVGDRCTDDTGAVVESFADPRIRYWDLPANTGDQAGPNNEGVRQARGEFIAFLNQDDVWFPDHLSSALAVLEDLGIDLALAWASNVQPTGGRILVAFPPGRPYRGYPSVQASTWVMRATLARKVGPWRPAAELHGAPSQDWLHRARKSGAGIRASPNLTVLIVPSAHRPGSYKGAWAGEHEALLAGLSPEALRDREWRLIASSPQPSQVQSMPLRFLARTLASRAVRSTLARLGFDAHGAMLGVRHRRKGRWIHGLRQVRGLEPADGRSRKLINRTPIRRFNETREGQALGRPPARGGPGQAERDVRLDGPSRPD